MCSPNDLVIENLLASIMQAVLPALLSVGANREAQHAKPKQQFH